MLNKYPTAKSQVPGDFVGMAFAYGISLGMCVFNVRICMMCACTIGWTLDARVGLLVEKRTISRTRNNHTTTTTTTTTSAE